MSGPLGAHTGGSFPPFEPPVSILDSLSTQIQSSIAEYDHAISPTGKAAALQKIQSSSTKLSRATAPIPQQFMELNFFPNVNVAVRIAIEMRLFASLPMSGDSLPVSQLATACNAAEEFLYRIARTLGAFDILTESDAPSEDDFPSYAHTPYSKFLTMAPVQASTKHLWDSMFNAQANSTVGYYLQYGFKNPENPKCSPFSFAHGETDASIFDIFGKQPERRKLFNDAMSFTAVIGLKELMKTYPFEKLQANENGVVLVDVGGGKGQCINEMRSSYPSLCEQGKLVLEDMKVVLDDGVVVPPEVTLQPYDFLKEVQPIKGSNYFLKSIFHDWPDSSCLSILHNLTPAMKATSSNPQPRLLICELVLPDRNPDAGKCLRDMNMLCIAGKERSLRQWKTLLGKAGYKIEGVFGSESPHASIIEVVLGE